MIFSRFADDICTCMVNNVSQAKISGLIGNILITSCKQNERGNSNENFCFQIAVYIIENEL